MHRFAFVLVSLAFICSSASATSPMPVPPIPVGYDAYRQWHLWPMQRIGVRGYMQSTYDRSGGNEGADASHFLYQLADDRNVTLDLQGPGTLYFARYNHWHGSPWRYIVDGAENLVSETSTVDPTKPVANSKFAPEFLFPEPLTLTWSTTRGADLSWVAIPFMKSFQMQYWRTHYGTGYYIFHRHAPGIALSQPPKSWDVTTEPPEEVLALLRNAGTEPEMDAEVGVPQRLNIPAHETVLLEELKGPKTIRALSLTLPKDAALAAKNMRLRITWDEREKASVDAPLPLFFGAGTLYNRDEREFLVKALPVSIRFDKEFVELSCWFPMPFFKSAKIELVNDSDRRVEPLFVRLRTSGPIGPPNLLSYFHATYKDHAEPQPGKDLVLLDTKNIEGSEHWSGAFVGTSFIFSHDANLATLEGDPRFFFDDSNSPQAQGTGTEEWGGGGDYWGGRNMTLPLAGHPNGARSAKEAKNEEDRIESAYRFLLADLFPFGKNARIQLEHGGTNESKEHYETVTYWYGLPAASLVRSDFLQIGDQASEKEHEYNSPAASAVQEIVSRYEWGPDRLKDVEVYPATADKGRTTTGMSEFSLNLDPDNVGVMLRRKLDYAIPNQRAQVYVSSEGADNFKPAGVWYTAGSSTCVYSNPKEELGATQHAVRISNRRFREEEFLLPVELARGQKRIRVRVVFDPVKIPLFPGQPVGQLAWSEISYAAYCYVMPKFPPP